jgi:hypothetical protein
MSEALDWDQFDSSGFVKFAKIGDKAEGTITAVRVGEDFNGNPCPVIDITTPDGDDVSISCGQAALKATVRELGAAGEVKVGRHISVAFTGEVKATKGMKKVFEVKLSGDAASEAPPF